MSLSQGRRIALSPHRRFIAELMRACKENPTVSVERRFRLSELVQARREAVPRPSWTVLFARAFALTAMEIPALRRSYFGFPRPHFYEHPEPIATVPIERDDGGEEILIFSQLRRPHTRPVVELDAQLRHDANAPLERVGSYRRISRLGRMPWPLRSWLLRLGLRGSGRLREKHFGTFVVTSPASYGAGLLRVLCPVTASLHYGLIDDSGGIDARLTFDHRVFDGATGARALCAMERALLGQIRDEIRNPQRLTRAA